jgi:hypothetical protein
VNHLFRLLSVPLLSAEMTLNRGHRALPDPRVPSKLVRFVRPQILSLITLPGRFKTACASGPTERE